MPPKRLSTGLGVCTCSYFFPDNRHVLYAGTFQAVQFNSSINTCPDKKCKSAAVDTDSVLAGLCKRDQRSAIFSGNTSYTWDIFPDFDIFKVNEFGNVVSRLTNSPGYDAEATLSPDGKLVVFTSSRSGDLELWLMNIDGSNQRQAILLHINFFNSYS